MGSREKFYIFFCFREMVERELIEVKQILVKNEAELRNINKQNMTTPSPIAFAIAVALCIYLLYRVYTNPN